MSSTIYRCLPKKKKTVLFNDNSGGAKAKQFKFQW